MMRKRSRSKFKAQGSTDGIRNPKGKRTKSRVGAALCFHGAEEIVRLPRPLGRRSVTGTSNLEPWKSDQVFNEPLMAMAVGRRGWNSLACAACKYCRRRVP